MKSVQNYVQCFCFFMFEHNPNRKQSEEKKYSKSNNHRKIYKLTAFLKQINNKHK